MKNFIKIIVRIFRRTNIFAAKKFSLAPKAIFIVIALIILLSFAIEKILTISKIIKHQETNSESIFSKEEKKTSGALESMQWMTQVRAYPEIDIPADKFYEAYEYSKNNLQELNERDDLDSWQSIGPNNIGGRTLCVSIHPVDTGTVYIGAASGGLWKSTTGGLGASAWVHINTGYPSSAVSSIAIDSVNPNIIYIGTGENYGYQYSQNGLDIRVTRGMYGIGILKTTNGGNTWSNSLDWTYNNKTGIWKVLINPKNSNILYAATSEGIYKSNNAGVNWNPILDYKMVMDLEINLLDTSILYASIGNLTNSVPLTNKGIFKTTNSGNSWIQLSGGLPASWSGKTTIELYKNNPSLIYASIPNDFSYVGYYKSSNGGLNWQNVNSSIPISNQGWYNNGHLIKSDDQNSILVGTLNVEKSINGGTSFNTKSNWSAWVTGATPPGEPEGPPNFVHADVHDYESNPIDPNKIYIATDGGLYRSNNFGETFYSCNGGFVTSQFYGGFANSYQDSIFCLGGLQDNRAAFYQGTTAWYKTYFGDGMWCAVNSTNDNICYTEYAYGSVDKSTNRGIDWNNISPPGVGGNNYCFVTPFICCRSNPNVMYVGGTSIYKSTIGGGNWQGPYGGGIFGAKILSLASSHTGVDTLYCGTVAGRIFRSVNAGLNWTNITDSSIIPNRYITDITINPNKSNELYITSGGFNSGHVFKSTDAGNSWQNTNGNLPDVPHHSVIIDPAYNQNIYVGNDLGVYVSTNSGSNWHEYRAGMPYALVMDLSIVYVNRKLRATTHGNGIYERKLIVNPVLPITLSITIIPEGFYDPINNTLNSSDTVTAYLRNNTFPYIIVDSMKAVIDSITFTGSFIFSNAGSGTYFIVVKHRNSIETWSKPGGEIFAQGSTMNYNFTSLQSQAFGNNMKQVDAAPLRFAVYSGDVNQDGVVDGSDAAIIDNDSFNFVTGYVVSDLTGDNVIDGNDAVIAENNAFNFVGIQRP